MKKYITTIFSHKHIHIKSLLPVMNGKNNKVYIINNTYVLRIPKKNSNVNYVQEQNAHNNLSLLPIPKILICDTTFNMVPFPYMIQTLVPGKLWINTYHLEKTRDIYAQAGSLLKKIHRHTFSYASKDCIKKEQWSTLFSKMLFEEMQNLPSSLQIEKNIEIIDNSPNVYCLPDYNEGNIMIYKNKISGIIDLEDVHITSQYFCLVQILDRMFHFILPLNNTFKHKKLALAFLQGYGNSFNIPKNTLFMYLYYHYAYMYNRNNKKAYGKIMKQLLGENYDQTRKTAKKH
ncbi:MAG: aminoglycoside phosphotransferase family protein [Candidatus Woesearchaeota archaeon]